MNNKQVTIHAKEAFLIKKSELTNDCIDEIKNKYTLRFYEEAACKKCEFLIDRHSDICNSCAAFLGGVMMAKDVKVGNNSYLSTPIGDAKNLKKILINHNYTDFKLKKHFINTEFKTKATFTGTLRDYQQGAVAAIITKKRGVVHLQPRAGKCVVGSSLVMVNSKLQPIKNLFTSYDLNKVGETIIPVNYDIATVKGERAVSYLYTKMVDLTTKVTTYDGYSIHGTPNHKVLALTDNNFKWVALDKLKLGDMLAISRKPQWLGLGLNLYKSKNDYRISSKEVKQTLPKVMTAELARLLAYWVASGNIKETGNLTIYSSNKVILNDFVQCCSVVFPKLKTTIIYKSLSNKSSMCVAFNLEIYNFLKDACKLTCDVSKKKKIPSILFDLNSEFMLEFVGSYISCNSNFYKNNIELRSSSISLISQIHKTLTYFGIVARINSIDDLYYLRLQKTDAVKLLDLITVRKNYVKFTDIGYNPNINANLLSTLNSKKLDSVQNKDYYFSPVTSIEVITKPLRVYDVCVPNGRHFIANGIVNHNTVIATAAICEVGKKTLILASQKDWLVGFLETFVGSKTQPALTNMSKESIGFCKNYDEFLKYDVCLATVQTFYSEAGKKLLDKIKTLFSLVVIDEVHKSAANGFASTLSKFAAERIIGLTGTFDRKDNKIPITANLLGPIIFEIAVERLKPTIRLVRTEHNKEYKGNLPWVNVVKSLESDPKRLKLIAEWAIKDAKDGHMVIIPLTMVKSIESLIDIINKLAGETLAYPFYGTAFLGKNKAKRDQTIENARNYKIKIIVGNAKMLSTGINIPRASMLYDVTPSSNLPNCEQRVSRILTPYEKPAPVLRIFLDEFGIRKNCLRNEWFGCIKNKFKAIISEKDEVILKAYFKSKSQKLDSSKIEF